MGRDPDLDVDAGLVDDLRLVVSEFATNAVHAADDDFELAVEFHRGEARVEVVDTSPELPRLREPEPSASHGRGLVLVAAVASDWGVDLRTGGKAVWATLALPDRATDRIPCDAPDDRRSGRLP